MIDAHFHIWQLARRDYGWLTPALKGIYRDVTVADWQRESAPCGVRGGVLVQAAPTDAETAFLLEAAHGNDAVMGVVGWANLLASDAVQRVEKLALQPKLKGLRPMLQDIAQVDWILQNAVQPALHAMADCGLTLDALVKPEHLPIISVLAARHPRLRIVIDHGAKPTIVNDITSATSSQWARDLHRLARESEVVCKLSGLWTQAPHGSPVQVVRNYAEQVLGSFGAPRVMWGSDWPVLELAGAYAQWHAFAHSLVPVGQHADVFEATARRIYAL